jgi:hypothetical protein
MNAQALRGQGSEAVYRHGARSTPWVFDDPSRRPNVCSTDPLAWLEYTLGV